MLPKLPSGAALQLATANGVLGGTLWPAASTLCRYLLQNQKKLKIDSACSCVELGSGTGAVGLFAASLGADTILTDCRPLPDKVTYTTDFTMDIPASDSDCLLRLLHQNVEANRECFPVNLKPRIMELDWANSAHTAQVASAGPTNGFDLVLASDVTHFSEMHCPLASTISKLLAMKTGKCLLSHEERIVNIQGQDMQLQKFEKAARAEGLDVQCVSLAQQPCENAETIQGNKRSIILLQHKQSKGAPQLWL